MTYIPKSKRQKTYKVHIYHFGRTAEERKTIGKTNVRANNVTEAICKAYKKLGSPPGKLIQASIWLIPHTLIGHYYNVTEMCGLGE